MSKKDFTEFTCDECSAKLMSSWGFPYDKEWVYIYSIEGKALISHTPAIDTDVKFIKDKDLHFCKRKCLIKYMNKKFKTGAEKNGNVFKK